jgi:hypothetical protein
LPEVTGGEKAMDIFEKNESWTYDTDTLDGFGPKVSVIVCTFSLSCNAEGLAREACCDDINQSRISCGVPVTNECTDVAENRGVVEISIPDAGGDDLLAVSVDFNVSNMVPSEKLGCEKASSGSSEK